MRPKINFRAPQDCTQYFWGESGQAIRNYNFDGAQALQNQDTNICVRREQGYCGIDWSVNSGTSIDPFEIGNNVGETRIGEGNCQPGYVEIPGSQMFATGSNIFCGDFLNTQSGSTQHSIIRSESIFKSVNLSLNQCIFRQQSQFCAAIFYQ